MPNSHRSFARRRNRFLHSLLIFAISVLLTAGFPKPDAAAQTETTTNLLIIGHSWTSKSGEHINKLSQDIGDIWAFNVMHGGYRLFMWWNNEDQMARILAELDRGIYDYAAIMDTAGYVAEINGPGVHAEYAARFKDLFAQYGVEMVLILPWEYVSMPDLQPILTEKEAALAEELGVVMAPVGEAFELSKSLRPDLLLTKDTIDDSHASVYGAYLRDLVLYSTIMRKPPHALAGGTSISEEDEIFFKDLAWDVVQQWVDIPPAVITATPVPVSPAPSDPPSEPPETAAATTVPAASPTASNEAPSNTPIPSPTTKTPAVPTATSESQADASTQQDAANPTDLSGASWMWLLAGLLMIGLAGAAIVAKIRRA